MAAFVCFFFFVWFDIGGILKGEAVLGYRSDVTERCYVCGTTRCGCLSKQAYICVCALSWE